MNTTFVEFVFINLCTAKLKSDLRRSTFRSLGEFIKTSVYDAQHACTVEFLFETMIAMNPLIISYGRSIFRAFC